MHRTLRQLQVSSERIGADRKDRATYAVTNSVKADLSQVSCVQLVL